MLYICGLVMLVNIFLSTFITVISLLRRYKDISDIELYSTLFLQVIYIFSVIYIVSKAR